MVANTKKATGGVPMALGLLREIIKMVLQGCCNWFGQRDVLNMGL
jgi:hypothetical protein